MSLVVKQSSDCVKSNVLVHRMQQLYWSGNTRLLEAS